MKEFMKNNTVTYNLMSFTGFKSLLIFTLLLEGPKTYEQIRKAIYEHPYLNESVSIDAVRIYFNSLKEMGCDIKRTTKNHVAYYSLTKQPFELKISDSQAKSILKVYKALSNSISISDFISLQKFFEKFSKYITNEDLKQKIINLSPLNNIDLNLIQDLMKYAQSNTEIVILYNSINSGKKNITILVDKLGINNGKLYVYGVNSEYKNYSSFLVSRILKIVSVNLHASTLEMPFLCVKYEYNNGGKDIELLSSEKIIDRDDKKIVVEIQSKSKFDVIQRILSHANKCKVIYPEAFKTEIISCLKQMKDGYIEEE